MMMLDKYPQLFRGILTDSGEMESVWGPVWVGYGVERRVGAACEGKGSICGMSANEVSGALGVRESAEEFGTKDGGRRDGFWRFVRLCHGGWGFWWRFAGVEEICWGLGRAIGLLEQALRVVGQVLVDRVVRWVREDMVQFTWWSGCSVCGRAVGNLGRGGCIVCSLT